MLALQSYDWPGNVRQLRNMVERLLILPTDDETGHITASLIARRIRRVTAMGQGMPAASK